LSRGVEAPGGYDQLKQEASMSEIGIERIVVGLDGSEQSRAALDWAIWMARNAGAEVIAVHAAQPAFEHSEPAKVAFESKWSRPLANAGVRYQSLVEEGRPASVIVSIADRVDADVIVVGRRGRGRAIEFLLGSVSRELTVQATRPVLLISAAPRPAPTVTAAARAVGRWAHQGHQRSP
jgi:nucleotide-binding universal stress UspA family protein